VLKCHLATKPGAPQDLFAEMPARGAEALRRADAEPDSPADDGTQSEECRHISTEGSMSQILDTRQS
jgi:hypothetical protein